MIRETGLATARLSALDDADRIVEQVLTEGVPDGPRFLLAHMVGGIVWGTGHEGRWQLSCQAHPTLSPPLASESLLTMRIFDDARETFVWRDEDLGLKARTLEDSQPLAADDPLRWLDEQRLLRGDRTVAGEPASQLFTPVEDAGGSRHAPPLTWRDDAELAARPGVMLIRHHLRADPGSGCVEIAASRCVGVQLWAGR